MNMTKTRIKTLTLCIQANLEAAKTGTYAARKCALEQAEAAEQQLRAAGVR